MLYCSTHPQKSTLSLLPLPLYQQQILHQRTNSSLWHVSSDVRRSQVALIRRWLYVGKRRRRASLIPTRCSPVTYRVGTNGGSTDEPPRLHSFLPFFPFPAGVLARADYRHWDLVEKRPLCLAVRTQTAKYAFQTLLDTSSYVVTPRDTYILTWDDRSASILTLLVRWRLLSEKRFLFLSWTSEIALQGF